MKIIINVSGQPTHHNHSKEYKNINWHETIIFSPYKGDRSLNSKYWYFIHDASRVCKKINDAFWMINNFIDNKDKNFIKREEIESIDILHSLNVHENEIGKITLKKNNISKIESPILVMYFKDVNKTFEDLDALNLWYEGEKYFDKIEEKYSKDKIKWIKNKYKKIISKNEKDKRVINIGNEGILYLSGKYVHKISEFKININDKIKYDGEEKYDAKCIGAWDKVPCYYNFDAKIICNSNNKLEFKYQNILLPTIKITYPFLAHSLIKQKNLRILIDDNKPENYAKYFCKDSDISKTVFADIGISFITFENDEDYKRIFFGIARDNYYLAKNLFNINARQKIRDRRVFTKPLEINDKKFKRFYDFISKGYESNNNVACYLKNLPKKGTWRFCLSKENTMDKVWSKTKNEYLDLTKLNEDKIVKCNCHNLIKQIPIHINKKEHKVLSPFLEYITDSIEVNFKQKIIALITTTGKRDMTKTIKSIENQSLKIDEIIIASEKEIKSKYNVFVNPYKKGLARNTMQALSSIKLSYPNEKIFIATIDDDDQWDKDYIKHVSEKMNENCNFITSHIKVMNNNKKVNEYIFNKEDICVNTFLYGNCGLQGSNKVFDLDIALESGGMPKHINASTDRAFNINLLSHPNIKIGLISKQLVIFNNEDTRDRISTNKNRINELRKFYKHFWHLIDKSKIDYINERHKKLHGFNKVITWK